MAGNLENSQIDRLWQHATHSQNRFDNRLNFFLVFESILLGVVGMLYSRPLPVKAVLIAMICLGLLLTVIWGYVQAREKYMLDDLTNKLEEEDPIYQEIVVRRQRVHWPLHSMPLLTYGIPLLIGLIWIALLIFVIIA